jgi:hypothetical protein
MKGDFNLTEDFEFTFVNGDFQITENTQQDANLVLLTNAGQIRNLPVYGVGIDNYLNSNDALGLKRKIIEQTNNILVDINNIYVDFTTGEWDIEISVKKINTTNA